MNFNSRIHHRISIRLQGYDYSLESEYFVTICSKDKECIFGEVVGEEMQLSPTGEIAKRCWEEIPKHFQNTELDEYVVMPNHLHGIIIINPLVGVEYIQPLQKTFQHVTPKSIASILRSYKAAVKRECTRLGYHDFAWQRNYYEHIIRDEKDLNHTREYIYNNPIKWLDDEEN